MSLASGQRTAAGTVIYGDPLLDRGEAPLKGFGPVHDVVQTLMAIRLVIPMSLTSHGCTVGVGVLHGTSTNSPVHGGGT